MNFFEHQQRARRRTTLAVLLFMLATLFILIATNLVVLAVVSFVKTSVYAPGTYYFSWLRAHPAVIVWTSLITLGAVTAASLFRIATLSAGGAAVARELGGTLVDPGTHDPLRRQLLNVVEEIAIASGVPAPDVYVLESEGGINALAAGFGTSDAAIAVTRGTLESLTRDELQGVIAHEFSHILNGDMRLNMRLIGVTFGILVIALTGRMILRALSRVRGASQRDRASLLVAGFVAGFALIVIGYIGVFFTRLIKAVVSRQRESLADASAVQFTRNPQGLAGALKKIAAMPLRATLTAAESEEVSHMLIAERHRLFDALFATHPPILERIKALDPRFDPAELKDIRLAPMSPRPAAPPRAAARASADTSFALLPLTVVANIGNPGTAQLSAAIQKRADIPPMLRDAAHSPQDALALVLALVLARDAATRARQVERIRAKVRSQPADFERLDALASQTARLDATLRLPLIEIAFPALRRRPPEQLRAFVTLVEELLEMDGGTSVLDYAFGRLLRVHLTEAIAPRASQASRHAPKLYALRAEAQAMFSIVARAGHGGEREARTAFDAGMRLLLPMSPPPYAPPETWPPVLDQALARLDQLTPLFKQALVEALVTTIAYDRQVTLGESELLRVVCASLHCPLPPLVAAGA